MITILAAFARQHISIYISVVFCISISWSVLILVTCWSAGVRGSGGDLSTGGVLVHIVVKLCFTLCGNL